VIVYEVIDEETDYNFHNFPGTGTRGAETELRVRHRFGYASANYSYYHSVNNRVPLYEVYNAGGDVVRGERPIAKRTRSSAACLSNGDIAEPDTSTRFTSSASGSNWRWRTA
jgi:hypothetical protein